MPLQPSQIEPPQTSPEDPRIGQFLNQPLAASDTPRAVIIGFPSDEGVARNGGRPGASQAPDAIREQLYKMTPPAASHTSFLTLLQNMADLGNINVSGDLKADQKALGQVVAGFLEQNTIPIILGGGHETAFGHFLGYAETALQTAILNLDAHTDVRPINKGRAHSGSPFRQAIEYKNHCRQYLVAGLQPHSVAKSHLQFIENHDGRFLFRDETNITSISGLLNEHDSDRLMVTFDMDAVDQSQAPGVSAPSANGLPADLWLTAAYLAGRHQKVTSFDLSEVNPRFDRDHQTAKLAALTIWNFLLGVSER